MNNENPAEMTNEDLERDMERRNKETKGNQENVSKSTAAEGHLKTPEEDKSSVEGKMPDTQKHNGNMPDPEELSKWEDREIDNDKMSG